MKRILSLTIILMIIILTSFLKAQEGGPDVSEADLSAENINNDTTVEEEVSDDQQQVIQTEFEQWVIKLKNAGATIPVLLGLSVIGVSLILERLFALRKGRFVPSAFLHRVAVLWQEGRFDEISALCQNNKSIVAGVLEFIVRHRHKPVADISMAAGDIASRELRRHLLRAYPLAVIATVAPLLGLLGTVSGMVGAFDTVALMGELGDAGALGGDISKALVSTLVGLTVAIPALIAYHFFKSRTQLYGVMLEEEVTLFITDRLMNEEGCGDAN